MEIPAACSFYGRFFLCISPLMLIFRLASAVIAPNMTTCNPPSLLPVSETPFSCCAPLALYSPRLFKPNFSSSSSPIRVRQPAHAVDQAYAAKLTRAYSLMKALPSTDPRSYVQQANIHCAYCNTVYNQANSSTPFQIHGSWLFFPFHRWYLYFHERILAKLLGDDDFTLSFWNYDHPDGASIPWLFSSYNSLLVDTLRDPLHNASAPAAIDYTWDTDTRSPETQLRENANTMYRSLIRDASTPELFFGKPFREGVLDPFGGCGSVELRPHNSVHYWVGQKSQIGWKDMGSLYAAGRDPLFYAHHAQIDRLWEVWKTIPSHYDYEDEDYLDAEFAFYNEDAELVRVKVGDSLNTTELGYVYEDVENPWMDAVPVRQSKGEATLMANDTICVEGELISAPCSLVMERDVEQVVRGGVVGEHLEFKVEYEPNERTHIDIYINLPSANAYTDSGCEEYFIFFLKSPAYLYGNVTDARRNMTYITPEMSERLATLNLTQATKLIFTIVPRALNTSIAPLSLYEPSLVYYPLLESAYW